MVERLKIQKTGKKRQVKYFIYNDLQGYMLHGYKYLLNNHTGITLKLNLKQR